MGPVNNSNQDDSDPTPLDDFADFSAKASKLAEAIPDELREQDRERLEYQVEKQIYQDAVLETPEGQVELSMAYYWSSTIAGECNIDIPHDEIPDDVELTDCRLQINSSSGIPLLAGPIVKVGQENGLGGNTTVAIKGHR